jgi:hypothetical protein
MGVPTSPKAPNKAKHPIHGDVEHRRFTAVNFEPLHR